MENTIKMSLSVGYSGALTNGSNAILKKIHEITTAACVYMADFNNADYGFDGSSPEVKIYTDGNTDLQALLGRVAPVVLFPTDKNREHERQMAERHIEYMSWICDHADIMIVVWNEHMRNDGYAEWELIQNAKRSGIPCVWINANNPEQVFLADKYLYERFDYVSFKKCFADMFMKSEKAEEEDRSFAAEFVYGLYDRFMKKYKAKVQLIPTVEDEMLKDKEYFKKDKSAEKVRKSILSKFNHYDREANKMSDRYRASLYMRAVLPFLATIFLSVGFYCETILGQPLKALLGEWCGTVCMIIAGVAFFVHALINLYAFFLSNSNKVRGWHYKFVYNRTASETLRLLIHILPFGQSLGVKQTLKECEEKTKLNINISTRLYDGFKARYNIEKAYNQEEALQMTEGFEMLIDDQIIYHKNSIKRYEKLVGAMEKYGKIITYIGFALVLARGVLQFVMVMPPVKSYFEGSGSVINNSYIRSAANMFALMVPAWASYFTGKLSLCGFEEFYNESCNMVPALESIKRLISDAKKREDIPFDLLKNISDNICTTFMSDLLSWGVNVKTRRITRI